MCPVDSGGCLCGGGSCAVLPLARLCRREEEKAACHAAGSDGQISSPPARQTGRAEGQRITPAGTHILMTLHKL